jgi:hypothetical protein
MSVLSSVLITSPVGRTEECAQFIIEDEREQYTLYDVLTPDQEHTFTFWVRSEPDGEFLFLDQTVPTTAEWKKIVHTFTSKDTSILFDFGVAGTYYIYHPQLELGNVSTDWSLSPEDLKTLAKDANATAKDAQSSANETDRRLRIAESKIQQIADQITMLVTNEDGTSEMTQRGDGWTFNITNFKNSIDTTTNGLDERIDETKADIEGLQGSLKEFEDIATYVKIKQYEGEPCIELGKEGSKFKLQITNTRIMFIDDSDNPTFIDDDSLRTENITVDKELRQGGFVWALHGDGENKNLGLMWKGV